MRNVLRLHKEAGCEHGEMEPENFVMRGNDLTSVRLIDFKYARVGHRCKYGDRHVPVSCRELNGLEDMLEIFKCRHRYVTILR